ncbi:high-temperature-induced dauer-formation protein-domain-containing protein [Lipomyces oligophaga]|uniref:high-temperature-induced dauer-formation protein-domain-containing protein n=1 Tax=Lipomyces oligophaga TaxID=45792 RepID=UPI0034CDDA4E
MGTGNSKLSFKQSVFRLFEDSAIPVEDPFWNQFWEVPENADDVFTLITAADVRRTRDSVPENLEHLIIAVITRLADILRLAPEIYVLTPATPGTSAQDLSDRNTELNDSRSQPAVPLLTPATATKEALNCMRILTRVLPFLFEKRELESWQNDLFWGLGQTLDHSDNDIVHNSPEQDAGSNLEFDDRPLGAALLDTLVDFLFLPGFAIPVSASQSSMPLTYTIWETGIGNDTPTGTTNQMESNKVETLRTLLAITSEAMYLSPGILSVHGVKFTSYLVCRPDKRIVLSVLCSLLNTAMKYNPGWRVPYNHVMFFDPRQLLVTYCLQFLLVLITYSVPESEDLQALGLPLDVSPEQSIPETSSRLQNKRRNWYKFYLGRVHRVQDLQFLADGMSRLLNQPMQAASSYLPGSQQQIEWAPELIMLFWDLIRQNVRFRNYIISSDRVHDFVVLFLFYAYTYRIDSGRTGLVRLCIYVLQTISADPVFSVRLNKSFEAHDSLPSFMRISGWSRYSSYADYLLLSIYSLMLANNDKLSPLYPSLLDIQTNMSPHISNIGRLTCGRMMQLYNVLSAPSFLIANESNHGLVDKMLTAMTDMIVTNNHQSNANLLYSIFRNRKRFEALDQLTLERCLEDVRLQRRSQGGSEGPIDRKQDVIVVMDNTDSSRLKGKDRKGKGKMPMDKDLNGINSAGSSSRSNVNEGTSSQSFSSSAVSESAPISAAADGFASGLFVPSQEWFDSWHSNLNLVVITHLLGVLPGYIPHFKQLQAASLTSTTGSGQPMKRSTQDNEILSAIRHLDDEVILPSSYVRSFREPSPFEWTPGARGWYSALLWGSIFVMHEVVGANGEQGNSNGLMAAVTGTTTSAWCGVWRGTKVALFRVQETKPEGPSLLRPRGAVDAVAKSMLDKLNAATGGAPPGD